MKKDLNSLIKEHINKILEPESNKVYKVDVSKIRDGVLRSITNDSKTYKSTSGLKKAIAQKARQVYLRLAHGDVEAITDREMFIEMIFRSATYSIKGKVEKHLLVHKCDNTTCPIKYFNTSGSHITENSTKKYSLTIQSLRRKKCAKCINQVFDNPSISKYLNQAIEIINHHKEEETEIRSFPKHIQKHIEQNMKSKGFNFNTDYKTVAILYLQHLFDNENNFIDCKKIKRNYNLDAERYRTAGQVLFNMGYIHQQDLSKVYQKELNNGGLLDCIKGVQSNRAIGAMIFNINTIKKKLGTYEQNKDLRPGNYTEMVKELQIYQNAIKYFSKANQTTTLKELINEFRSQLN
nr:hypothetical protein [uncultured Carboxylicivirga sp.]